MADNAPSNLPLERLIPHIFLPPKLPQQAQSDVDECSTSLLLCRMLKESTLEYKTRVPREQQGQWDVVSRMLDRVADFLDAPMSVTSVADALASMNDDDVLALHIRAQNAAVIVRKGSRHTSFEVFEVSSSNAAIYSTPGKLLITYPGPAVSVPNTLVATQGFCENTALFLSSMDVDVLDSAPQTKKAGSTVQEVRDTSDPKYISQLFIGILHGCAGSANPNVRRVTKHISDEVMWHKTFKPWRRLPLWLILRVALQTTLSEVDYKALMVLFMSHILAACADIEHAYSGDLLFVMQSKIARRLAKLGGSASTFVITAVSTVIQRTKAILDQRWESVQIKQSQSAPWNPPSITQVEADTRLSLTNATPYIRSALDRNVGRSGSRLYPLSHAQRVQRTDFHAYSPGLLAAALSKDSPRLALADFEDCVFRHLDAWVWTISPSRDPISTENRDVASETLLSCFHQYLGGIKRHYSPDHPEDQSIAILTLLALWRALDRIAIMEHPLLEDYSPEIPSTFLEPLVLRDHGHVLLANDIETYLRQRHERVPAEYISLMDTSTSPASFALRTFEERAEFPYLKTHIENHASYERQHKRNELEHMNAFHRDLQTRSAGLSCTYEDTPTYHDGVWRHEKMHAPSCNRCALVKQANSMSISVHEWPLPSEESMAKLTVFELACPPVYSRWRDTTYCVLTLVGNIPSRPGNASPFITLRSYGPLSVVYKARASPFVLASDAKPFIASHYRSTKIPATESSVCVNNGLKPWLYHSIDHVRLSPTMLLSLSNVAHLCTPQLASDSLYRHLQPSITSTTHTSNEIIADQASCPKQLNLHEHIAFASLRAGGRLQWLNILRELRARDLTFNAPEVYHLVTQAIWQLGPLLPGGLGREWHLDLEDASFCRAVLDESQSLLISVGENWMAITTVRLLVTIVLKILEVCPHVGVKGKAHEVLRATRSLAALLRDNLHEQLQTITDADVSSTQNLVCEAAAVCAMTYDVSFGHLLYLLNSPDDVYELVRSLILVQENTPVQFTEAPLSKQSLLYWHERVTRRVEVRLRTCILEDPQGLHRAVGSIWPNYSADGPWRSLPHPDERQLTRDVHMFGRVTHVVHFDLLSGRLLVNCHPLGQLPASVTMHPIFQRHFAKAILNVIPAADPRMEYETRTSVSGWVLSFAMHTDERLIVRASRRDTQLELIPHEAFRDDVPRFLADDHVHWLDLVSGDVEFRPLDSRWVTSENNWWLTGLLSGNPVLSRKPLAAKQSKEMLIDSKGATFSAVNGCLGALEYTEFSTVTLRDGVLFVDLPRLRLSFFMNQQGHLESLSFRDMIVDSDQSYGTLVGLRNQLVLCAKDPAARTLPRSRRVIVPDGTTVVEECDDHVAVFIQVKDSTRRITPHIFIIDHELRCLSNSAGTVSLLFQCLLHAVTSGCLPDPLTGHTGTEQALLDLGSPRMKPFARLSNRDLSLLHSIASLTPERIFYPQHLSVMQEVIWADVLPSLSQHAGFKLATDAILASGQELDLFHDRTNHVHEAVLTLDWETFIVLREDRLLERSMRRISPLHALGIPFTESGDCRTPSNCTRRTRCICRDDIHHARHFSDASASIELRIAKLSQDLQVPAFDARRSDYDFLTMLESFGKIGVDDDLTLAYSPLWMNFDSIALNWLSLYRHCLAFQDYSAQASRVQIVFSFCSLAFHNPGVTSVLKALLALCLNRDVRAETLPAETGPLDLRDGYQPARSTLKGFVSRKVERSVAETPAHDLSSPAGESAKVFKRRQKEYYQREMENARTRLVQILIDHWPQENFLRLNLTDIGRWIVTGLVLDSTSVYFNSCRSNSAFADHLRRVQTILRRGNAARQSIERELLPSLSSGPAISPTSLAMRTCVTGPLSHLLSVRDPPLLPDPAEEITSCRLPDTELSSHAQEAHMETADIHAVLTDLSDSLSSGLLKTYLDELHSSVEHLDPLSSSNSSQYGELPSTAVLRTIRDTHALRLRSVFDILCRVLSPRTTVERQLDLVGLWPRVTERTLLQLLSFSQRGALSTDWMRALSIYACHILVYQRSQRLLDFSLRGRHDDLAKELQNTSLADTNAAEDEPDWLLVQIEGNFLARPIQRIVARDMISPSSAENSLQQLNMGEGKTSVIVPFIVTALAHGDKLVRVVVLKALSNQMFGLLVNRLSGLTGRRVFSIPFSRGVAVSEELVRSMEARYTECVRTGGVLVVQPEHILSFKLMVIDYLTSASSQVPRSVLASLWRLQEWISGHTRDVLDESDELLHARYQLIYTIGTHQPLQSHPYRWTTIQQVLVILKDCAEALAASVPHGMLLRSESVARFPSIRLLTSDADEQLTNDIVERIMSGAVPDLHFSALPSKTRGAIQEFIVAHELGEKTSKLVRRSLSDGDWKGVLLLRGLLALGTGVLLYVLKQRRWRVDFGLDPKRSMLAVPYRAKDVPSLKAEFGHPDVSITLTCLSYYHGGLTAEQVGQCFSRLLKMDDPRREYTEWVVVGGNDVPGIVRELSGINLKDKKLVETILVPTFSHNYAVVNFFLAQVVFPREAREFPHKLGTSAWDLAERKTNVTTGFSGTKDNRFLLPTTISQKDLPEQRGTDALVLSYMLQAENTYAAHIGDQSGEEYLHFITSRKPEIRVLLDVGAQMLDMKNRDLVRRWLELCDESVQAAIFFTDTDDLAVLTRDGIVEDLRSSPFDEQLDKCIVYLDDVHTRGTDLKLPTNYRAALTVGHKVTKDRLVQGAMRMRNLGHGQSVLILAPAEIDRAIRKSTRLDAQAVVEVRHVLQWAMLETCADIVQHIPHWAEQGIDYERRRQGLISYDETSDVSILRESWVRPEARTLEQMYGTTTAAHETRELWESAQRHSDLMAHLTTIGVTSIGSARLSEEQEREVVLEVERERQIERPVKVEPALHFLHPDVLAFVQSGHFPSSSPHFTSLLSPLRRRGDAWNPHLLATRDFAITLAAKGSSATLHDYLRPVNWVLSCGMSGRGNTMRLIVISPFEANELLPSLRTSTSGVRLHIFTPRLMKSMPSLSDLRFHVIPALPGNARAIPQTVQLQLALWSGELWIKDYASYKLLCVLLGLYMGCTADEIHRLRDGGHIASDGFVRHSGRSLVAVPSRFSESPVERLRELFGLRRKGVAYLSTHMGHILTARELEESAFDVPS